MSTLPNPESRNEQYLQFLATGSDTLPEKPESRIEEYLAYLCEHGGGGSSAEFVITYDDGTTETIKVKTEG